MPSITFRCDDELVSKLKLEANTSNVSVSNLIVRKLINETNVEQPPQALNNYMTEERFDYRVEPFSKLIPTLVSRIEQLEEAIKYYDNALVSLIEEPTLLNAFKDPDTQELLLQFIERLKDPNAQKTITVIAP